MTTPRRDSHCSFCGAPFEAAGGWPRTCARCASVTYRNPIPVAVVLLPVDDGLLAIRRAIEPHAGRLALPGGYVSLGETWQQAAARELEEETGVRIDPEGVRELRVLSGDSTVLIFGLAPGVARADLPASFENEETSESVVLEGPTEMAFPHHTRVVREFFARRS
jgi:8-oxo-dGTP pyrophosphatase MutT (NUDIX family)